MDGISSDLDASRRQSRKGAVCGRCCNALIYTDFRLSVRCRIDSAMTPLGLSTLRGVIGNHDPKALLKGGQLLFRAGDLGALL